MRPRLHLTAARGWLNDPHGITWHDGRYHVFHQALPDSLVHDAGISWGHATSPDLVHFEHHPPVLEPDDAEDGIWTGCVVVDGAEATAFYTAVSLPDAQLGRVRVARPADPGWDRWTKGEVVVRAPEGLDLVEFRDPFVLRETSGWRMFVAGAARGGTALVATWVSDDLTSWEYDGVTLERSTDEREPAWMGEMWECPQFFPVADRWAMVASVWTPGTLHHTGYALGTLVDGRFTADTWGRLSWGSYYAPSYFLDREGRPSLVFWIRDVGDPDEGWQSCLSVPHLVDVRDDRLVLAPHPHLLDALDAPLLEGPDGLTLVDGPVVETWSDGRVTAGSPQQ
jgi:beta-fructofuranosidase